MTYHDDPYELGLFWHWGPIVTLILSATVTLTTWKWWPPEQSLFWSAHFALYMLLNVLSLYNFVKAVLVGPGLLPRGWHPVNPKEAKYMQYCKKCEGYKAPRVHHCRRCDRCVMKMDHHCPWINRCVGWSNQMYFVFFLFFYLMSNLHAFCVLTISGYQFFLDSTEMARRHHNGNLERYLRQHFFSIFMAIMSFGLTIGIVLCMLKLLVIQIGAILKNITDVEQWIVEKARARRYKKNMKPFVFPYNLGWKLNLAEVFNIERQHRGHGIEFPVVKGCNQYTLTLEQLAQKAEKRNRTRTYKCILPATGSWLPIWSQGLRVTFDSPLTDDPRIKLEPNDLIRVTRKRKHWLFGERVVGDDSRKGAIRGWFPRRCAVEVNDNGDTIANAAAKPEAPNESKHRVGKSKKSDKTNKDL
ncbi:PREDICTED: palmitoyltransferase ZDHHC6 [Drosophila arizonae]|uniref:Palmitoyltransferase n=1 Tax=Drosophila arizonae TaxID=7263 RepID=A0ABM1P1Q2_DROAR|nr:PREDICTED: palmitoyltransferase ZDHHC6 [Drosophila arizonae]